MTADADSTYPPLPLWSTVRAVYGAFFSQFVRLSLLMVIPFLLSAIAYIFSDLLLVVNELSPQLIQLASGSMQVIEVLLFFFFSVSAYRLLLLGSWEASISFDAEWRRRLVSYALRSATVFIPIVLALAGGFWGIRQLAVMDLRFAFLLPVLIALCFYLYLRVSFALAGASVDAPYSILDSWRATSGISLKIFAIGLMTILPPLLVMSGALYGLVQLWPPVLLGGGDGVSYELTTSYWLIVPFGIWLSYVVAAFVVFATGLMFYQRTGWRPGAVRSDH